MHERRFGLRLRVQAHHRTEPISYSGNGTSQAVPFDQLPLPSLAVTVSIGGSGITRMREVGNLGVNQRLNQRRVWDLARTMSGRHLTPEQTLVELAGMVKDIPRHGRWVTALAVGAACAAFGRLLGVDWPGTGPVLVAAVIGQLSRSYRSRMASTCLSAPRSFRQ